MVKKYLYLIFFESWWVIAFIFACAIVYEQGLKERDDIYQQLTLQKQRLHKEKETALLLQENLQLQINSQSDPAWIELTLIKVLGLVPEGQKKIYFYTEDEAGVHGP